MKDIDKTFLMYALLINVAGFASMGIDKLRAVHQKWRISEKTLFLIALLGGSIGSLMGMGFFHHKTLHLQFRIGIPAILIAQIVAYFYLSKWLC